MLRPDETFWVFGSDNTFYLDTGRSPVTGQLFFEPLVDDPQSTGWARVLADVDRVKPSLILTRLSMVPWLPPTTRLPAYITAHYIRVEPGPAPRSYGCWVRQDDNDLIGRLRHMPGASAQ